MSFFLAWRRLTCLSIIANRKRVSNPEKQIKHLWRGLGPLGLRARRSDCTNSCHGKAAYLVRSESAVPAAAAPQC